MSTNSRDGAARLRNSSNGRGGSLMATRRKRRRANGEGTIVRRKDGRWCIAVHLQATDGTIKRVFLYGKTYADVRDKLNEVLEKSRKGIPIPAKPWKVGEYLDYWLEHVAKSSLRPATYALYETMVRLYIKPGLGRYRLDRLSVSVVQAFLNGRLRSGDSVRKVQVIRTTLSSALTRALREELVTRNVARLATLPEWSRQEVQPWSAMEARTFLQVARTDSLYPAFLLLIVYGMRRGEVLGLRWQDVDLDGDEIRIRQQLQRVRRQLTLGPVKTRAGRRELPLLYLVREALKEQQERQLKAKAEAGDLWHDTGLVITTRTGRPVEPRNLVRSFERICERHGLRQIRIHDLRHTAASLLKKLGVPARDAMVILGHSRISVTQEIYTYVDDEARRDALGRMHRLYEDHSEQEPRQDDEDGRD